MLVFKISPEKKVSVYIEGMALEGGEKGDYVLRLVMCTCCSNRPKATV